MLPPLEWFVRSRQEPVAVRRRSQPWRIAILHTSNHSSHPGGSGNFDSLFQNHYLVIQGEFKKDGRQSSVSIRQKAGTHMKFQAVIIKRGREGAGVDYCAGLQKDQLCITWDICAVKTFCSLKKWWISHCCSAGIFWALYSSAGR